MTSNAVSTFSKKNARQLTSLGKILSNGKVDQVIINDRSPKAFNTPGEKGKSKVTLPTASQFPEGFTEEVGNGLLDHELAHGKFSGLERPDPKPEDWPLVTNPPELFEVFKDFVHGFHNTLEDRRIDPLYALEFPGGGENIDALNTYAIRSLIPRQMNSSRLPILAKIDLAMNIFMLKGLMGPIDGLATWVDTVTDPKGLEAISIALDLKETGIAAVTAAKSTKDLVEPACSISYYIFQKVSSSDINDALSKAKSEQNIKDLQKNLRDLIKKKIEDLLKAEAIKDKLKSGTVSKDEISDLEKQLAELKVKPSGTPGKSVDLLLEKSPDGSSGMKGLDEQVSEVSAGLLDKSNTEELKEAIDTGLLLPIYVRTHNIDAVLGGDQIIHLDPDQDAYAAIKSEMASSISVLSRILRNSLEAVSRTKTRHEQDAGDIDAKSLYKLVLGSSNQVFYTKTYTKGLTTIVTLLVDLSGSMRGPKLNHAIRLCVALYEAMKPLKIKVEILGFTTGDNDSSRVRSDAMHYIAKSFNEALPFCIPSFLRVPHRCNADPDAIRWASRRMLSVQADRKILLVLSDGQPSCSMNGFSDKDLERDLISAVRSVIKAGIEIIGFGICDSSVNDYYPWPVVVNDPASLTVDVLTTLKKSLIATQEESLHRMDALSKV